MRAESSPVYELDAGQNTDVEVASELNRSRFAMGMARIRQSDEEIGYGAGNGNGYGDDYRYP